MRAVTFDRYGPPEVLHIEEVPRPEPKADEALVLVHAGTTTRSDCGLRSAEYLVARLFTGVFRPRRRRVGIEFAGEVEAVGSEVTELAVGDRVFGICDGGNADYVTVRESDAIARIPDSIAYDVAAATADGALSAMSLLPANRVGDGTRVLVYGASGSIGVGGVQVAKRLGAHVTAVCGAKSLDLMRSLGADEVVDYLTEDFAGRGETYDVVFDAAGKTTFRRCRRALASGGLYITTDPGFLWHDAFVSLFTKRAKLGIVRYRRADLETVAGLLRDGGYRPVIDRTYPLEAVVEAHRYVDTHQKTGSVVLSLR